MSTLTFDGVRFAAHSDDHLPPHVHGFYAEVETLVELTPHGVTLAGRRDAIRPGNGKRSDVAKILNAAAAHEDELIELWRSVHVAS